MDFEAIESIATTGTVILSAIYAITSYKKNKALDSTCIAFEKFYAPAFFWLKKCMYQTDKMATEKFKVDMNEFRTIYIENNIYASAFVQVSFDKFDTSWNEWLNTLSVETTPQLSQQQDDLKREADKHFKSFCDNFITDYNTTIGKTSGDKYISTVLRNKIEPHMAKAT